MTNDSTRNDLPESAPTIYGPYESLNVELGEGPDAGIAWVTIDNGPVNLFDADPVPRNGTGERPR